jgi:hypothetical protein
MRRKGLTKARPRGKVHRVFAVEKKFAGVRRSRERWSGVLGNARLSGSGIQRFAQRLEAQDLPLRQIRLSFALRRRNPPQYYETNKGQDGERM